MDLKIKRLHDKAQIPTRGHKGDAGLDFIATEITQEFDHARKLILVYHTGWAVEIPDGYVGLLFMRSSVSNFSLSLTNAVGVIDSTYRGEVIAKFKVMTDTTPAIYEPEKDKFIQLVIVPIIEVDPVITTELSETDRGDGGYGSTDEKEESTTDTKDEGVEAVTPEVVGNDTVVTE